jgi:hypothetical protein
MNRTEDAAIRSIRLIPPGPPELEPVVGKVFTDWVEVAVTVGGAVEVAGSVGVAVLAGSVGVAVVTGSVGVAVLTGSVGVVVVTGSVGVAVLTGSVGVAVLTGTVAVAVGGTVEVADGTVAVGSGSGSPQNVIWLNPPPTPHLATYES